MRTSEKWSDSNSTWSIVCNYSFLIMTLGLLNSVFAQGQHIWAAFFSLIPSRHCSFVLRLLCPEPRGNLKPFEAKRHCFPAPWHYSSELSPTRDFHSQRPAGLALVGQWGQSGHSGSPFPLLRHCMLLASLNRIFHKNVVQQDGQVLMSLLTFGSTAMTFKFPWAYLVAQELSCNFVFLEYLCSGFQMFYK